MAIRPALRHPICLHYLRCQDFHRTWLVILLSQLWLMRHEEIDELTNCCYYLNFAEPSITLWSLSYQEIFLSTQFGHIGNGQMSFVFGYIQHSWFSSFLIIRMQCIMVFRLDVSCHQKYIHFTSPNIPITMQQARSLCDKNVCHVSPATSGKKMFYRYIIISQIDPIQPCL